MAFEWVRESDTTEFQKLHPTFSHAACIGPAAVAASCGSLLLSPLSPSPHSHPFPVAACSFQVLAIETAGYIDIRRYLRKSATPQESSQRHDVDIDFK